MRDLDAINPPIGKPQRIMPIGAILPFFMGAMGIAFADGAAPTIPFMQNPIGVFSLGLLLFSLLLALTPWFFKWAWQAKYFGLGSFYLGSFALLGWIPILCIALYGKLPFWLSAGYVGVNIALTIWWCRRFVLFYRRIHADANLWVNLYVEEHDAVYYTQKCDKWLFEKKFKFSQFPSNTFLIIPMVLAFLLAPFMSAVTHWVGVPFTHIFLAVSMIPINLMCLGWATRAFLIYYYYPWQIKRQTGKTVYVDMATPAAK